MYAKTARYELIVNDKGMRARKDVAFWRVSNGQPDFCSLGDIATEGWGKPRSSAILVKQLKSGALVKPTSFTRVWIDKGSNARSDIAIFKMNAPSGYKCLGKFFTYLVRSENIF